MTLVVCWKSENKLSCLADTRISNSGTTISDSGGKIFIVPITLRKFGRGNVVEKNNYTLGFAFCGSTLLANNTHVIATNCSQLLRNDGIDLFPDAQIIANLYARAAEYVTRDVNSRVVKPNLFQGLIFGYCPASKDYKVFSIEPKLTTTTFTVEVMEIKLVEGGVIAIGSGKDEFIRQSKILNSAGNQRGIFEIVSQIMEGETVADVGGYPQLAEATVEGVNIVPILTQSKSNLDQATLVINGLELNELKLPEGLGIGLNAIGIGVEKIAGRNALRAKGIDPDTDVVTKEIQNLASIEASLKFAYRKSIKVQVDDNFTIEKSSPVKDMWYLFVNCKKCSKGTPLIFDPSNGSVGNPFSGNGKISTICFRCGSAIESKATGLYSKKWDGT